MLLLAAGTSHGAAAAAPRAVLTLAEQPLRLIRGAAVYKAAAGVALLQDDILETGAGGAQIEVAPDAIVALGAQTRVLLANLAAPELQLQLLQGWVKVQAKGRRVLVVTPALQLALAAGATIVNADPSGLDAVFAEDGAQQAARFDDKGRAGAPLKLATEQFVGIEANKPQLATGRPSRAFLAAMPRPFRDRLVPASAPPNAGKAPPVKERDADFADVAAWLQAPLPARRAFVARFKPRLADAGFRAQLDRALGQSVEWKPVLHPVRPSTANALF